MLAVLVAILVVTLSFLVLFPFKYLAFGLTHPKSLVNAGLTQKWLFYFTLTSSIFAALMVLSVVALGCSFCVSFYLLYFFD
jgi:hypothetical protein